jgi:hypothetical protein
VHAYTISDYGHRALFAIIVRYRRRVCQTAGVYLSRMTKGVVSFRTEGGEQFGESNHVMSTIANRSI